MEMVETLIQVLHVLTALAVIGLVLIQQGKGADMGSGFGSGASATVFGSGGAGNFLTRMTTTLAIVFFVTSFGLAVFAKQKSTEVLNIGIPQVEDSIPVDAGMEIPAGELEMEAIPAVEAEIPSMDAAPADDAEIPAVPAGDEIPQ